MIRLKKLLKSLDVISASDEKDKNISGIAYHSEKVETGNIFICIKGHKLDGHTYLQQALTNGAVAAIVEEFQDGVDIPQYLVKDSREALAKLATTYYDYPSKLMKMIGITATNGKTTTSFMVNAILEEHGLNTGLIGTVMIKMGETSLPAELTTPESLELQKYLREMVNSNVSHVTMEVSSAALDMKRVTDVDYDIVTFNNASREHIDAHGSFENYLHTKASLITNVGQDKLAILNLDCPYSSSLANKVAAQTITFGIESKNGHFACSNLDLSTGRGKFTVEILKPLKTQDIELFPSQFDVELSVPGYHSVYNSMVAIIIGLLCGVPIDTIQKSLKYFSGVERRFEFIFEDDIRIIDDHFANTGNINVTLGTLKFMDYNNLNLVYAIRGDRGPIVNKENAEAILDWAPKLGLREIIATRSISHVTEKDRVTDMELKAFQEVMANGGIKIHLYDELPDAISHALSIVSSGDLILLAGCQGMDYGAQIALQELHKRRPEIPKSRIFSPLQNRISGVS